MGLDVSHDCWSGAYSGFMRYRIHLHHLLSGEGLDRELLLKAWDEGRYADQSVPINVLMNHSDCDGEITPEQCGPLADALEALLVKMPERGLLDEARPATLRWIAGLRDAAAKGETVEFY